MFLQCKNVQLFGLWLMTFCIVHTFTSRVKSSVNEPFLNAIAANCHIFHVKKTPPPKINFSAIS